MRTSIAPQPLAGPTPGVPAISSQEEYEARVNPQWVRLLKLLQMNVTYTRCEGVELHTSEGARILDFLSGYCVHNLGHNHPNVLGALRDELDRCGPAMLQSHVPERAGELASRLCELAGPDLKKVFFCSSGSEGVEAAIKFARAHTSRSGLLYADGAFHGLTCGALSLMGDSFWKKGFGPLLPETQQVPFNDAQALRDRLKTKQYAAFVVEPVQGEAGIRLPSSDYLGEARALCDRYGTLLVFDEVQTGFCRTGPFLAAHHYGVQADIVILAKAISGGLVPSGALLMTDAIYESVFGSLKRSLIHTSTFSENGLAMRAGLAVLDTLEEEKLAERSASLGEYLRRQLHEALDGFEMIEEVRGLGLFTGICFRPPEKLGLRVTFEAFAKIHPALFGQVLVMRLFRDHRILTQICGNNFMVLKVAPPLIVTEAQIDQCVAAIRKVVEMAHSQSVFWSEALGLVRRVVNL
jgi:ornithine--oxo-acid transaminase